jgi:hypothetical protein
MINHLEGLRNSQLVDIAYIEYKGSDTNNHANYWKQLTNLTIGTNDLRPRRGTFTTPWNATSNKLYRAPEFKFINDTLSDLHDARAIEINNNAKRMNKRIAIMWSGGIDSTSVLVSFLKNLSTQDLQNVSVILNTFSIFENFDFYSKHISNKLHCLHYSKFDVTDEFLSSHILLHGDPGDCLYGPSMPMYSHFIREGKHLEPWKNHLDTMATRLDPGPQQAMVLPGFGKWYTNKITNNLLEVGVDEYVSTIANWWWWTYYNFKWEFSCQRPLFSSRSNTKLPLSDKNLLEYSQNVFYHTDKFQQWSYSNLKTIIGKDVGEHKKEAKMYIYNFDKNDNYLAVKTKVGALPANYESRVNFRLPLYYDKNWVGYSAVEDDELRHLSNRLLENYKG